jgi:hypothetical protein
MARILVDEVDLVDGMDEGDAPIFVGEQNNH